MKNLSRRGWIYLVGVCSLGAVVVWMLLPVGIPFDADQWHRPPPNLRAPMADRLVADGSLLGKTKPEIFELLGKKEPHPTSDWGGIEVISYPLGPERSWFSIDEEYLRVFFGPNGRVIRCYIS